MLPTKGAVVAAGFGILIVAGFFMVSFDGESEPTAGLTRGADPARALAALLEPPASRSEVGGNGDDPRFSPALLAYARDEIRRGWRELRDDEVPEEALELAIEDFKERVLALPVVVGRGLKEE